MRTKIAIAVYFLYTLLSGLENVALAKPSTNFDITKLFATAIEPGQKGRLKAEYFPFYINAAPINMSSDLGAQLADAMTIILKGGLGKDLQQALTRSKTPERDLVLALYSFGFDEQIFRIIKNLRWPMTKGLTEEKAQAYLISGYQSVPFKKTFYLQYVKDPEFPYSSFTVFDNRTILFKGVDSWSFNDLIQVVAHEIYFGFTVKNWIYDPSQKMDISPTLIDKSEVLSAFYFEILIMRDLTEKGLISWTPGSSFETRILNGMVKTRSETACRELLETARQMSWYATNKKRQEFGTVEYFNRNWPLNRHDGSQQFCLDLTKYDLDIFNHFINSGPRIRAGGW